MHAELTHPRALIADQTRASPCVLRTVAIVGVHTGQARLQLLVDNVDAEIGLAVDVELRAGTKCPNLEVVVAGSAVEAKRRSCTTT